MTVPQMKIRVDFQISHGDEFHPYGMTIHVPTAIFAHQLDHIWEWGMAWHYEQMAGHLINGIHAYEEELGLDHPLCNPHLVTHPEDLPL